MPQCPACKAPYEMGQHYCELCNSYLLHPEEGDYFCSQCGIRVAPTQEICHQCNAKLSRITAAPTQAPETRTAPPSEPPPAAPPTPTPPPKWGIPPWGLAVLIGAGFLIVIILGLLLRQGTVPTEVREKPPPTAPAPTAEATLADEVRETLSTLREAQLKNDIILFMSCYSYLYPSLDKKRETTLSHWKNFKFLDLNFILDEVKPLGPDSALARVTWTMQIQNRESQEFDSFTQVFNVVLAKELGRWRVRTIKDMTYEASKE